MTRLFAALLAGVPFLLATPSQAQVSDPEAAIASYIDDHAEDAVALLERLVNINSGTLNLDGVRAVGGILDAELADLGFDTRWIDFPTGVNRAGHLYGERLGSRGSKLLLIGHLDTVFEEDDPFQKFERRGSVGFGPGTDDMKGGDVTMVLALQALFSVGALDDATIRVVMTGDEERPGSPLELVRGDLIAAARQSDIALGFEGGIRDAEGDWGTIARRSASSWTLTVRGTQAHSSQIFTGEVGAGAIFEASRILSDFYDEVRGEEYLTFNAGMIVGGTNVSYDAETAGGAAFGKTNVVPKDVIVAGGIRTISQEQLERSRAAMQAVVQRHLPHTDARIVFAEGYPAMAPTEGNQALFDLYRAGSEELGLGTLQTLDPSRRGGADISFVAPYVDGLAGLGSIGTGAHSPAERVDLDSIALQAKRAAILIYRLTQGTPAS